MSLRFGGLVRFRTPFFAFFATGLTRFLTAPDFLAFPTLYSLCDEMFRGLFGMLKPSERDGFTKVPWLDLRT
jgi:hypothetical protein